MEYVNLLRFVVAFVFVIALIMVLAFIARRYGMKYLNSTGARVGRLGIEETLYLDSKHRMVLVRRDNVEHLLLLGQQGSHVIETNITPPVTHEKT